ncbi:acyltransferase [Hymenobacter psychrotolerans]|uniref:Hexapeptide repeat of succinyl-transferase n=1 Tax=Hymenobacter psychrotolerans DSM 18569 TaxID=1121959 RepID=A0A1M7BG53_9BACT|nr:acyltransferase [Hymenobacter psychrotolerans]SHL53970.1 Hexapeptide repeat of succinyl-transferase [Hymenobacter psychrotolerans DSM 18569]
MPSIHSSALVETKTIGSGTTIWAFVHILPDVTVGSNCNICDFCFIESGVSIGNNVTLKSGIYLWKGVVIEDNVFLGPNVVFTNDLRPRSKQYDTELASTLIGYGASLGANSTILAGVKIGRFAMTGIGSVVTRSVPAYALVYGNPARQHGWVDERGEKMIPVEPKLWRSRNGDLYTETVDGLQLQL